MLVFARCRVPSDLEEADPISVIVVYCLQCGTTLHMF